MKVSKPDRLPKRKAPRSAFKPGYNPHRNMRGNLNAALQSYEVQMRNFGAKKLPPDEFAEILAEDVRHRRIGAREFWGKYIVGEPSQKHEHSGEIKAQVVFLMPRPNGNNKEKK